jgi:1,4-alpha-glucan branching enzyme
MEQGFLALILHAHLPFVRHPEYPEFLEEDWLYEAITETYIPLLFVFENLLAEGVKFRITMTLTPSLCEMLADPMLQSRYSARIANLVKLTSSELIRTKNTPFEEAAKLHHEHFVAAQELFEIKYQRNLLTGFRKLQDAGALEVITCAATHGFLPLMSNDSVRRAQIQIGCRNYAKHFGRWPRGIWLPECAYQPGLEKLLSEAGLKFFIVDSHSIMFGDPRPKRGIFAPTITPSGVAAFARDVETSEQVWSSEIGYPGHPNYREFYRDIGWDAEEEYIKPFLHSDGNRRNLGIKYFRVTGKVDLHLKHPYIPQLARETIIEHANHFIISRLSQMQQLNGMIGRRPIVVSPYDAELFGHWWFEGPQFLNTLIKKLHYEQNQISLITPSDYLSIFTENQKQTPSASTWGAEGYNRVWINSGTSWMYPHQHMAERRMTELARRYPNSEGLLAEALNQAARELVLAQSSDWAFIITTGTMVPYAIKRFKDHIHRFTKLYEDIIASKIDEVWLRDIQSKDNIFPEIDYKFYRSI